MTYLEVDRALEEMGRLAIAHETAKHNADWTEALAIARESVRIAHLRMGYPDSAPSAQDQ